MTSGQTMISRRLLTICQAFDVNLMPLPSENIADSIVDLYEEIATTADLHTGIRLHLEKVLQDLATENPQFRCSLVEEWRLTIVKEKAVYNTLNLFKQPNESLLVGSFWAPKFSGDHIFEMLSELKKSHLGFKGVSLTEMIHDKTPPTFLETNDFTGPFQEIINTYGVPRYKEINPGYVTIVTFSFQFGVMFGDVGHGLALFLVGLMIAKNKNILKRLGGAFEAALKLRYLLMMMGFFSIYCGLIYNDFVSLKLYFAPSCYELKNIGKKEHYFRKNNGSCIFPIGFDWVWGSASNEVAFMNSFKMKLSIIIGVLHMTLGLVFKGINCAYFGNWADLFLDTIPQILFFLSLFGYMSICIIVKWLQNWKDIQPPNIINLFINFNQKVKTS